MSRPLPTASICVTTTGRCRGIPPQEIRPGRWRPPFDDEGLAARLRPSLLRRMGWVRTQRFRPPFHMAAGSSGPPYGNDILARKKTVAAGAVGPSTFLIYTIIGERFPNSGGFQKGVLGGK